MADYVGSSAREVASPQEAVETVEGNWLGLVLSLDRELQGQEKEMPVIPRRAPHKNRLIPNVSGSLWRHTTAGLPPPAVRQSLYFQLSAFSRNAWVRLL